MLTLPYKLRLAVVTLSMALVGLLGATAPAYALYTGSPVMADFKSDACTGVTDVAGGSCDGNTATNSLNGAIKATIDILSAIVGVAAIIVLIISGLRFITASGDTSSVATARSGIIYALVGLVIVAMAQFIVHFVLAKL